MTTLEQAAASVYRPLASTATGTRVVADAFSLFIDPAEQYQESQVKLQEVEFAAFAIGGLAAGVSAAPAAGALRASALVQLPLSDSSGAAATAVQPVTLYGPGDVRGLDFAQIVRRHPSPGAATAEETVLAHVEFDRPELPWQFSAAPAAAGGTLRPWLALIVVEKSNASWEPATGMLPVLRVPLAELPDLGQAALWAHAQAQAADNAASLGVRLSPAYADVNLSRLVSPRILRQDTDYVAAVVPILDAGVRAGLGLPAGTLDPAWSPGSADPVRLPVYDRWEFRTGPDGDFRRLALRLDGVVPPYEVGRRFVDASAPGEPLDDLPEGEPGARQVLRCALFSPTTPTEAQAAIENAAWPEAMVEVLQQELNRPAQIEGTQERSDGMPNEPIVGPRIYAAAHRGSETVAGGDWFAQLNLHPMNRIVGGLGTRVVQRDQESLMQAAWAQLGEIEKANEAIRQAQFAELMAERLHARIAALQPGRLLQVAAPLSTRVTLNAGRTLACDVATSATAPAALAGAFRRAVRPGGPMLRRAAPDARARSGTLVGEGATLRDFTRLATNADGIGRLEAASIGLLDTERAAQVLNVAPLAVGGTLTAASAGMAGGLPGFFTRPAEWGQAAAHFDFAGSVASRWSERLQRTPDNPVLAAIREQRVAPLAAELATARTLAGSVYRERLVSQAVAFNNALVTRLQTGRVGGAAGPALAVDPGAAIRIGAGRLRAGNVAGNAMARSGGASIRLPTQAFGRVTTPITGVSALDPSNLTRIPQRDTDAGPAVDEARGRALASLAALAPRPVTPVLDRVAGLRLDQLRASVELLVDPAAVLTLPEVPRRAPASVGGLLEVLQPSRTVRAALRGRLVLSDAIRARWPMENLLRPIMAAPRFNRPMYEALNDYDRDWLVPGLGLLPADDFVTVLETNPAFVESFLVGLSDEMGRELLWRGFPTDRRGTCFWRFWDREQDELAEPIHRFVRTALGRHVTTGGDGGSSPRAAIVVKSELVRRFPDLIIDVVRNQGTADAPVFETEASPQQAARELFAAFLAPDIAILGIDLSIDELDRPESDWWILVAEHPTAIRFERPDDAAVGTATFLPAGGSVDGASFAADRLHDPTRVAFRATDLIRRG